MDDYTIDEIHANFELIEEALSILRRSSARKINTYDIQPLHDVLVDMASGFTSEASEIATRLQVPATPLRKIIKFEDGIDRRTALAIAERLRTHFKMLESNYAIPSAISAADVADQETSDDAEQEQGRSENVEEDAEVTVRPALFTEGWILVHRSSSIQSKIATISDLISTIISNVERSNLPEAEQILSQIEKKQLIAILETALEILKAPMVEVGCLGKQRNGWARRH